MTEILLEKKLERILMIYDKKESNGILTQNEYNNFLHEILRMFKDLGKRDYRVKIYNKTYSVLYDPDISVEYNMKRLKKILDNKINQITYTLNLKDGIKTKVSRRLVNSFIEDGSLSKNDFGNCYKKYSKKYIEITKVSVESETSPIKTVKSTTRTGYGICKRCGKPISVERLAIYPNTENCVACIEEVQKKNPRKHIKMKEMGIAGTREDVKKGHGRSRGDH
jgi:RNA polymerase-binding transcription factor DksA